MTESPRRNIFLITRSRFTFGASAVLPFSVHISVTSSRTLRSGQHDQSRAQTVTGARTHMLQWRSNARTRAKSLWLFRTLISTRSSRFTALRSTDSGPVENSVARSLSRTSFLRASTVALRHMVE
jgi:hypothetical protein